MKLVTAFFMAWACSAPSPALAGNGMICCGLCCAVAAVGGTIAIWRGVHQLKGMNGGISGLGVTVGKLCGVAALIFLG